MLRSISTLTKEKWSITKDVMCATLFFSPFLYLFTLHPDHSLPLHLPVPPHTHLSPQFSPLLLLREGSDPLWGPVHLRPVFWQSFICSFVCLLACLLIGCEHMPLHQCRGQRTTCGNEVSFHHVGFRDQTQVGSLGGCQAASPDELSCGSNILIFILIVTLPKT